MKFLHFSLDLRNTVIIIIINYYFSQFFPNCTLLRLYVSSYAKGQLVTFEFLVIAPPILVIILTKINYVINQSQIFNYT